MALAEDVQLVREVVERTATFPEAAKELFLEGLPQSIAGTSGALFDAAMEDAKAAAKTALTEVAEALATKQGDLATASSALAEAQAAAQAATEALEKLNEASGAAARLKKEHEQEHKAAEKENAQKVKKWAELRAEHERVASVVQGPLQLLVSGGWQDEEVLEASREAVKEHLTLAKAEKALIAGAGPALGCRPDDRTPFDSLVIQEVSKSVTSDLSGLKSEVAEAEPQEKLVRSELLGLWAMADCARDDAAKAAAAEDAARKGQKRTHDELKLSQKIVGQLEKSIGELEASKVSREQELEAIEAAAAAAKRLKTAPAAEPAAAAPAEPAEIEAPVAAEEPAMEA